MKKILNKRQAVALLSSIEDGVRYDNQNDHFFHPHPDNHKLYKLNNDELLQKIFNNTNLDEDDILAVVDNEIDLTPPPQKVKM